MHSDSSIERMSTRNSDFFSERADSNIGSYVIGVYNYSQKKNRVSTETCVPALTFSLLVAFVPFTGVPYTVDWCTSGTPFRDFVPALEELSNHTHLPLTHVFDNNDLL